MSTQSIPQPDSGNYQYVKLPDGSYGKFASNATDDVIKGAISKDFPDAFAAKPAPQDTFLTDMMGNGMPTQEDLNPTESQHPVITSALKRAGSIIKSLASPPANKTELLSGIMGPVGPVAVRAIRGQVQAEKQLAPQLVEQAKAATLSHVGQNPIRAAIPSLEDARAMTTGLSMLNPFASGSVANVNQLQDEGRPDQALGEGAADALFLGAGLPGPQKLISGAVSDVANVPRTVKAAGPGLMRAADTATDALADALIDPRKTLTETIPQAAGKAVRKAFNPPTARPVGQPPTVTPAAGPSATFTDVPDLRVLPEQQPPQNILPQSQGASFQVVPPVPAIDELFPSAPALIDPFAAQEQDLGGLADPLAASNPSPITNPIKPQSTLPAWATEVKNWESSDPQYLFNQMDEHDWLNYQRQEEIQQWIAAHNKQPEPFAGTGLKTSEPTAQRTIGQPPTQTVAPQPQVPTDANTEDLLAQSIAQAQANKAQPRAVGQPPVSSKIGGAKVLAGDIPLKGPVSPVAADISRLNAELKTATDPNEIADIKQALEHAQARLEDRPYTPPEQAAAENLPLSQPRTIEPGPSSRGQGPAVQTGAGLTLGTPVPVSSIPPGGSGIVKTSELNLDPKRFQYKANTDEGGTTNQFKDTEKFNRPLAGVLSVWTDPADGKTFVVNGHNRFELAERTGEPAMLVRHLEASTPESARAQGALINIAEGRGTAVDAAKFLRNSGLTPADLKKQGISLSENKVADGMALSKLDPSIFDKVATGQMPEQRGIAIGNATTDPVQQHAIVDLIEKQEAKGRKITNDTVAELSRFVANSENKTIEQGGLFGANQEIQSTALDKAELSGEVRNDFSKEKRVFGAVSDAGKAQILSRVKDQSIQAGENAKISQQAAQHLELYDKLSVTKGPINDILESVARDKADGRLTPKEARAKAYDLIRTELQKTLGSGEGGSGTGSQTRPGFPAPPK